jgi:hypothetical protein
MANAQTVVQKSGPLPITASFEAASNRPALVMLSGSVFTNQANSRIGVTLSVDGTAVGSAWIFANQANSHMAVVPVVLPYTFSFGPHQISLSAMGGATVSDQNDSFMVTILY